MKGAEGRSARLRPKAALGAPRALVGAALCIELVAPQARAEDPFVYTPFEREATKETFGMAEFGVGILTLPTAEVCAEGGCSKGDQTLTISAWPLFRRGQFAVGAGLMLGLLPTTDAPRNDPVPRDHKRSYLTVEATGRYYVPLTESLDGWLGVTAGLVVVNDTFQSKSGQSERALVGPRGVTIITEGGTVGLAVGLAFPIAENWVGGGHVRVSNWFLPSEPATDPLGDEASLQGRLITVDLGLSIAYRSRFIF